MYSTGNIANIKKKKKNLPMFSAFTFILSPSTACFNGLLIFPGDTSFLQSPQSTLLHSGSGEAGIFYNLTGTSTVFLITLVQSVLITLIQFPPVPAVYLSARIPLTSQIHHV